MTAALGDRRVGGSAGDTMTGVVSSTKSGRPRSAGSAPEPWPSWMGPPALVPIPVGSYVLLDESREMTRKQRR